MSKNEAVSETFPASFQISRQLDQEKIHFLTDRIDELLRSNNELRTSSGQNEKDTHDIVLYFQREMEIKDDIILRLNEELVKCQTQLKFEVEKVRKSFESELLEVKTTSEHTIAELTVRLSSAESDLKSIEIYRQEKDSHEGIIARLEKGMLDQREQLIDAMEEQERRFLEEKSQIFKDLDEQKAAFREIALKEARSAMGDEARKILADNNRMFEELKFHHSEAADYQAEKNQLTNELITSKREVTILAEKEIEYAKQAYNRSKEIKALRERVEQLEKQQSVNIERFKLRAKELKSTVTKELEEATLDAAGLRRLIHIKNKELKHMKSLAATILTQRTETEQFFLEALQEVKEVVAKERVKKTAQETRSILNKMQNGGGAAGQSRAGNIFPPLNIKSSNLYMLEKQTTSAKNATSVPSIAEQLESGGRVNIKDLSWEDKELVLRVLFAKMNGTQSAAAQAVRAGANRGQQQPVVFVSEGGNLPSTEYVGSAEYQTHFEVHTRSRRTSNGSSRLDDGGESGEFQQYSTEGGEGDEQGSRRSGRGVKSGNSSFNEGSIEGGDDEDSI